MAAEEAGPEVWAAEAECLEAAACPEAEAASAECLEAAAECLEAAACREEEAASPHPCRQKEGRRRRRTQ